jgi:integrase
MPRHGDNIRQRTKQRADGSVYVYYTTEVDMGLDRDGKRMRLPYQHAVRAEVERWRRTKLVERDHGLKPAARDKATVGGWCEHWLEVIVTRQYRDATLRSYSATVRSHILPALGRKRLDRLKPIDIDTWVSGLLQGRAGSAPLAPSTARRCLVVLRKALAYAVRQGFIARNVAAAEYIEKIVVQQPAVNALSRDQVAILKMAITGSPDAVLYAVELPRGMRVGELLGLRWQDVDFNRRELHIRKQAQRGKLVELKTASSQRILSLTPGEIQMLRTQHTYCMGLQLKAGKRWQAEWDLVFPTETGRPRRNANQHKAWKRLLARAGLPLSTKFHDLRHTAATLALADGMPIFDVSRMLGHASLATTADRYGAWTDEGRRATAERMERIINGA